MNSSQSSASSSSSTTSYSAELLSCFSDFNMASVPTAAATSDSPVELETTKKDTVSNISDINEEPSTNLFSKAAANHNYTGSGSFENCGHQLSKTSVSVTSLQRSFTTSSVVDSQEAARKLTHVKTIGVLPTKASVMSGTSTREAAGSAMTKKEDSIPIAVAFIESVNAFFRGNDQSK